MLTWVKEFQHYLRLCHVLDLIRF